MFSHRLDFLIVINADDYFVKPEDAVERKAGDGQYRQEELAMTFLSLG
jgi:hypothetical protein